MSIVTTYTCDKCARVQETGNDMYHVALVVRASASVPQYGRGDMMHAQLWCIGCVQERLKHLVPRKPEDPPPTPPTMEDMIREIVQEEMEGGT